MWYPPFLNLTWNVPYLSYSIYGTFQVVNIFLYKFYFLQFQNNVGKPASTLPILTHEGLDCFAHRSAVASATILSQCEVTILAERFDS